MSKFSKNQIVVLKSDTGRRGMVSEVINNGAEIQYKLFIDGKLQTFYESQLDFDKDYSQEEYISVKDFNAHITALQIKHPSVSSLYSLNSARIDFIPYQFRPVLKFIKSDRPRLLIADSVGVGKTIEAGLILQELKARKNINSVLIICPRPLVAEKKWENEMKRFGEEFIALNGETLRHCIKEADRDGEWIDRYKKIIIPYSLFNESIVGENKKKNKTGLLGLDPAPHFDLVIVDEAHHIRNRNWRHEAVKYFCDNSDAVVFLTATPIQLRSDDLFTLLNVLRPDLIIDKASFNYVAEPNQYINKAVSAMRTKADEWQNVSNEELEKAISTDYGKSFIATNNDFIEIQERLKSGEISDSERIEIINKLENLNSFSNLINRTRRRDIGNFTIREPMTVKTPFSEEQKTLYDEILRIQKEIYEQKLGIGINEKFVLSMISRQIASCSFGLIPNLKGLLQKNFAESGIEEIDDNDDEESEVKYNNTLKEQLEHLIDFASKIKTSEDFKLKKLQEIIAERQKSKKNKIMVFSTFRHTLSYLYDNLKKEFRIGLMHGGTSDEDRRNLRERFEKNKEEMDCLDVMLFSEIGCEGLDYQFCDCMINYDLPWNPMKIEQRIGRIDRNGQDSEKVMIYNLVTPETIDADIYERCLTRIGVFEQVIGECEEILGEVANEIEKIASNFDLTEEQKKEKFQQLADNKIREIQEQEKLEKEQVEFFGIKFPKDKMKQDIENASSFWLSSEAIYNMTKLYLIKTTGKDDIEITGEENKLKKFLVSQEAKEKLLVDYRNLNLSKSPTNREWEKWLQGEVWKGEKDSRYLPLSFDSEIAKDNNNIAFVNPTHPLAKQAARNFPQKEKIVSKFVIETNEFPEGEYEFAIYQWQYKGILDNLELKPIVSNENLTKNFLKLLEKAVDDKNERNFSEDFSNLESQHYVLWKEEKEKHIKRTIDSVEIKKESLKKSFEGEIRWVKLQIEKTDDDRRKMIMEGRIKNSENSYNRQISELESAKGRADILVEVVAFGILTIKKEDRKND